MPNLNNAAGPGAVPNQGEEPKPILTGATEYEYADIFNPLSVSFIGQFGTTRPTNAPVRINYAAGDAEPVNKTEQQIATAYGLNLRNPAHQAKANIIQTIELKAGETKRLLGNEAQVLVKQLVNEILSRRGSQLLLADAFARNGIEQEIIKGRGLLTDIMGAPPKSIQEQFKQEVDNGQPSSPDTSSERAFSSLEDNNQQPRGTTEGTTPAPEETLVTSGTDRRKPGRPRQPEAAKS